MSKIVTCEECGIEYYSETIVPRMSFRHVYPDIVKLETELAEARAEIERLALEVENKQYTITCASEENQQLKESLAEARAEIERLKRCCNCEYANQNSALLVELHAQIASG